MQARKIYYAREAITHSIIIQEERIKKITNELKEKVDNKIPATTISSISYGIARSANKNLYKCYKVANKIRLKGIQKGIYSVMRFFRKIEINSQQGKVRMNSERGQQLIKLIQERYERPIHIVDMLSTFIGTERFSHGLGFYKPYYEPIYNQMLGYICIEESLSINQQAHTLIHELVHAKFQDTSWPHGMSKKEYRQKYAVNEVVAESVAFVLCRLLGICIDEQESQEYIIGYMQQALKRESLDKMMEDVEKISISVLNYLGLRGRLLAAM